LSPTRSLRRKTVEVKARTSAALGRKLDDSAEDLPLIAEDAPEKTGERA